MLKFRYIKPAAPNGLIFKLEEEKFGSKQDSEKRADNSFKLIMNKLAIQGYEMSGPKTIDKYEHAVKISGPLKVATTDELEDSLKKVKSVLEQNQDVQVLYRSKLPYD